MTAASPLSKADLRAAMRARRRDLAAIDPGAAEAAALHLPLDDLPPAAVAAGYHAQGAELNPWPVLRRLAGRGSRIVLPAAADRASPLVFRVWTADQALQADAARIPSPTAAAEALIPQLVIAPLLAFDRDGYRLGQGGGYYDRTLQALRARGPLFVVGLGYAGQEIDRVPREPHDQPVDAILTERGYHRVQTKDD
ncbi:MAG: 5-formyltetrahydrofolate cyclo-ligase [Caulobacteraceae bacterium]|nr:5-formyltetrahydrofolate cyclo-ligase [Caulobacteraceae bacterium]